MIEFTVYDLEFKTYSISVRVKLITTFVIILHLHLNSEYKPHKFRVIQLFLLFYSLNFIYLLSLSKKEPRGKKGNKSLALSTLNHLNNFNLILILLLHDYFYLTKYVNQGKKNQMLTKSIHKHLLTNCLLFSNDGASKTIFRIIRN